MMMMMAMAMAMAMAVIRREYMEGGRNYENLRFMKKQLFDVFWSILAYFGHGHGMAMAMAIILDSRMFWEALGWSS